MRSNLPRYVERIRAKGRDYYYFRRGGARFRLPGAPGDAQFTAEYLQRLGAQDPAPRRVIELSIGALIRDYKASDEYRDLSASAQKGYGSMLDFLCHIEHVQASQVERHHLERLSAKLRAGKKRTKKLFAQVASVAFNFGIDNGYCRLTRPLEWLGNTNPWPTRLGRTKNATASRRLIRHSIFSLPICWLGMPASAAVTF